MKFSEFSDKLQEIKKEYQRTHKKELETIEELEKFLAMRKFRTSGRRHLKSLKGLGF